MYAQRVGSSTWLVAKLMNSKLINLYRSFIYSFIQPQPAFSCPLRDFSRKAKSQGGTLVVRAYIQESTDS